MTASIAIIGAGPAGLFAAEHLSAQGRAVSVYEKMPTPGRKFLMAGRGGLNLTHGEDMAAILPRYRAAEGWLAPMIEAFPPSALRAWAHGLGQETFVGSSGRIFPEAMKASPLLRTWRARLEAQGVALRTRNAWTGWDEAGRLVFASPDGEPEAIAPDAVLLALGGASWPRLGSDAAWTPWLRGKGVEIIDFRPSNCGVEIAWSEVMRERFAGEPLKNIALSCGGERVRGEAMITGYGLEGGAVYALSPVIRAEFDSRGESVLLLDLRPDRSHADLQARLERAGRKTSFANRLRRAGLPPQAAGLVREAGPPPRDLSELARLIKALPLKATGEAGLPRAISSAGGISREAVTDDLMLTALPGVFVAGEMLDWDAPTGGYLLQACFSTGLAAAKGVERWLSEAAR
jgi:uncharacterized flavoprotein (TIGR03862 family)